jgi:23S rRNA pseudouridine1911/1915/1917 synthase
MEIENHVPPESAGSRLDAYLARTFPDFSRSYLQSLIEAGQILVNGRPAKKRVFVHGNDTIAILKLERPRGDDEPVEAEDIPLDVLYEDDYLLAINKPAGLVVHPGHGNRTGTLVNALAFLKGSELATGFSAGRPGIVHRLDKETSGVLLVAKTDTTHAALAKLFAEREIDKRYLGICVGHRPADHGMIEAPLGRSRREPLKRTVTVGGRDAKTEYWLLGHRNWVSAMRFQLHTGRTHQIRVHCQYAAMPIMHDADYGGGEDVMQRVPPLERPFAWKIYKCFNRQALHAWTIAFKHPFTKKNVKIEAPLPDDMRTAIELLDVNLKKLPK